HNNYYVVNILRGGLFVKGKNLIEEIARRLGCDYISDLRDSGHKKNLIGILPEATEYPLAQWNDAVEYLCTTEKKFETAEGARDYILYFLN
ncbi:MAG: hypothetical protein RR313_07155, partial [Anaerovoracaceae bacterium]